VIKLERVRTAEAIPAGLRGKARVRKQIALIRAKLSGQLDEPNYWTNKSGAWKPAKDQLRSEAHGKCAYCEAPTDMVAHGDVEHFRPKSKYWWLAYCYDNYLYACQVCNETFKLDHFDIDGTRLPEPKLSSKLQNQPDRDLEDVGRRMSPDPLHHEDGRAMDEFLKEVKAEKAHLPEPYLCDPEPLFNWFADPILKEVEVRPADNRAPASRRAFQAVVKRLGLNRPELNRWRWILAYKHLETSRKALQDLDQAGIAGPTRDILVNHIREMMKPEAPFAAMVRYFVLKEWGLDLGPSRAGG